MYSLILMILSCLIFGIATFGDSIRSINLIALGLCILVASFLTSKSITF